MSNNDSKNDKSQPLEEMESVLAKVRQALNKIRYGAVEIVIHNSRVVQIEAREKIRFDVENKKSDQASGRETVKK